MYAKLFSSLYQGTLRGRSDEILVFTNMLAFCDQHGIVDKHWQAIADETGLSVERVKAAIAVLESPDAESRSPEMDGCRITRADDHRAWGWHVTNHGKYRAIRNEDDRREQSRLAQQRFREKHNADNKQSKQSKPMSAHTDTDTDTDKVKNIRTASVLVRPEEVSEQVWTDFTAIRKAKRSPLTETALKGIRKEASKAGITLEAALQTCCERGWQSFKAEWVAQQGKALPSGQQAPRSALMRGLMELEGMKSKNKLKTITTEDLKEFK